MNVAEIRADLADALSEVVASVAPHRNDPVDGYPTAIINIDSITPQDLGDESYDIAVTVTVVVSEAETPDGWKVLDELLSSNDIADALTEADSVSWVGGYDNIGVEIEYNDGVALGFTISLTVVA
jgi:hypothetical protein